MNLTRSIKIALAQNDKTQTELARELGVTKSTVNKFTNAGSMNTDTLQRLANHFEMPVSKFVALGE